MTKHRLFWPLLLLALLLLSNLYHDPEFFDAEKRAFLRATPQVVCHESEIALAGGLAGSLAARSRKRDKSVGIR